MTKLCSVCATENKDDAQFCRACGTALSAAAPTPSAEPDALAAGIACDECGFQNKPGVRYCANCGVSLLGTVIVPRSKAATPDEDDPFAGLSASPPPLSYPSYEPVAPYPSAPAEAAAPAWDYPSATASSGHAAADYPPAYDSALPPPDVPDADLAAQPREQAAYETPANLGAAPVAAKPNRAPLIAGIVVVLLLIAGGAGWWFMSGSKAGTPPEAAALPAPTALPAPLPVEPASAVAVPSAPASMPLGTVAPGEAVVAPVTPPAVSAADSQPSPVVDTEAEAKHLAAEKLRREKLARDKAERDAKVKALAAEQAAAAARADQEALARRRAEETQRQRVQPQAQPTAPAANPIQARGVREICAGRGSISESICQSRECGDPVHYNEAVCRQIRDADERRRNIQN